MRRPSLRLRAHLITWFTLALLASVMGLGHVRTIKALGGDLPLWQQVWCGSSAGHPDGSTGPGDPAAQAHPCVACASQTTLWTPIDIVPVVDRQATARRVWQAQGHPPFLIERTRWVKQARAPPAHA